MFEGKLRTKGRLYGGTVMDRVRAKTGTKDHKGCIPWIGGKTKAGYGSFCYFFKKYYAHRVVAEAKFGKLKPGDEVCHKCDNPGCINPDHLFIGTHAENIQDCVRKGRQPKGEDNGQHKVSEKQVRAIRELLSQGVTQKRIAQHYPLSQQTISEIATRKIWKHI